MSFYNDIKIELGVMQDVFKNLIDEIDPIPL
jgi:hypothetical protein